MTSYTYTKQVRMLGILIVSIPCDHYIRLPFVPFVPFGLLSFHV